MQSLDDGGDFCLPSSFRFHCSPGKGEKRRSTANPILKRKKISVADPASAHTSFEAALERSFAESGAKKWP